VARAVLSSLQNAGTSPKSPPDQILRRFEFLFSREMKWKYFEAVAISPELGAVIVLYGQSKMLPPNYFRRLAHRLIGIPLAILIYLAR
jgi:uncharacterized protein YjeT (DUF2065 family)